MFPTRQIHEGLAVSLVLILFQLQLNISSIQVLADVFNLFEEGMMCYRG